MGMGRFMHRTMISATLLAMSATAANAADAQRQSAGKLADGSDVAVITLTAHNGVLARILAYGATPKSLFAPDRKGRTADVLLGYDDLSSYVDYPNYFGATIGRYANRIAGGRFVLDGHTYQVPQNDHGQSVHGGGHGFDKVLLQVVKVQSGPVASVVLRHVSEDADAGYPGTLTATVTYRSTNAAIWRSPMKPARTSRPWST